MHAQIERREKWGRQKPYSDVWLGVGGRNPLGGVRLALVHTVGGAEVHG